MTDINPFRVLRYYLGASSLIFWVAAVNTFLAADSMAGAPVGKTGLSAVLEDVEILPVKIFKYDRTQRDPFVGATVKLTLLSETPPTTQPPVEPGLSQFTAELNAELLHSYRIHGIVCGERDGVVLIGRRILHAGDKLELMLGTDIFKKIYEADQEQHLGLQDVLAAGSLSLEIASVTPTGIWVSHELLEEPLELPFLRHTTAPLEPESNTTPK